MEELEIKNLLNLEETIAKEIFEDCVYPWEIIPKISEYIIKLGNTLDLNKYEKKSENIWIAKNAKISPTVEINGPCIIDENAQMRHCSYIRGNVIVGKNTVIGNSTELKNSIIFNGAEIPHFNYVGDSIVGYKAHMGGASALSNLKSDKSTVSVKYGDKKISTNLRKFGSVLGDYAEIGASAILNPGTIIGRKTNVYPLSLVRGYIGPNKIYKNQNEIVEKI